MHGRTFGQSPGENIEKNTNPWLTFKKTGSKSHSMFLTVCLPYLNLLYTLLEPLQLWQIWYRILVYTRGTVQGTFFCFYYSGIPNSRKNIVYIEAITGEPWQGDSVVSYKGMREWGTRREYWIIYRGPCFLAVLWFVSSPTPSPLPSISSTDDTQEDWERKTSCERERRGGGRGPEESLVLYKSFNILWGQDIISRYSSDQHFLLPAKNLAYWTRLILHFLLIFSRHHSTTSVIKF